MPVPPGQIGEILVRPKVPFGFMAGYHALPDKTVEAWRNLWFHTGDAGVMDDTGLVTFVDRIKDCIRRRGENISAAEVEAALLQLPGVAEVAAFAVPSSVRGGEDEVMLAVVPMPGASLTPQDHRRSCPQRVAALCKAALCRARQRAAQDGYRQGAAGTTAQARRRTGDLGCRSIRVVSAGLPGAAWRQAPQGP